MSEREIKKEIKKINDIIDLKIMKGLSYKRESLKHILLLSRLSDIHRFQKFNSNWFQRFMNNVAIFLL